MSADVGIDTLQGPSELVVVASRDADPTAIVLDLEAQAEHGAGAWAALLSDDAALLRTVAVVLNRAGSGATTIALYRTRSLAEAVEAAAFAAPEHLQLAGRAAARLATRPRPRGARRRGCGTLRGHALPRRVDGAPRMSRARSGFAATSEPASRERVYRRSRRLSG